MRNLVVFAGSFFILYMLSQWLLGFGMTLFYDADPVAGSAMSSSTSFGISAGSFWYSFIVAIVAYGITQLSTKKPSQS
ncbi:hypothetical protein [Halobacillus salinus]|uniref:Uncharacterized protein n=1 Tax=Halobacillus salinus TaxID=192814 RepID=A0A4Z0H3G6_9BACI|nr:hypothetical protein [Halobacillus salinus]TGB04387.1 hypothetical protein E4663_05165 [Halobacillus salinus]